MKAGSKIWREAASIILVAKTAFTPTIKPTDFNYKILTLQRSAKSGYMPGSYVFPGGVLCHADVSTDWIKLYEDFGFQLDSFDKLSSKKCRPRLYQTENSKELPKYLSLRIGAIRETFEESGVLICRSYKINYKERSARWASFIGRNISNTLFCNKCSTTKYLFLINYSLLYQNYIYTPSF